MELWLTNLVYKQNITVKVQNPTVMFSKAKYSAQNVTECENAKSSHG